MFFIFIVTIHYCNRATGVLVLITVREKIGANFEYVALLTGEIFKIMVL